MSVAPPAGWVALQLGSMGRVGGWAKGHPQTGGWTAAVTVEAEPLEGPPQDYPRELAARMGGAVSDEPANLDGVEATRVNGGTKVLLGGLRASAAVVAVRGQHAYVIAALESPDETARDAAEALRASWKWVDCEPPARHLHALCDPVLVFGKFEMQVPAVMRRFEVQDDRVEAHLGTYNCVTLGQEASVEVIVLPSRGNMEEVRSLTGRTMFKMFNLTRPPTWTAVPGRPRRWVSSGHRHVLKDHAGRPTPVVTRHAVVELSDREAAAFTLIIPAEPEEDRTAYEAAMVRMIDSIQSPSAATRRGAKAAPLGRLPWTLKPEAGQGR